jgi:hypothetical protein
MVTKTFYFSGQKHGKMGGAHHRASAKALYFSGMGPESEYLGFAGPPGSLTPDLLSHPC